MGDYVINSWPPWNRSFLVSENNPLQKDLKKIPSLTNQEAFWMFRAGRVTYRLWKCVVPGSCRRRS